MSNALGSFVGFLAGSGCTLGLAALTNEVTPAQGWTLLGLVGAMIVAQWRFTNRLADQLDRAQTGIGAHTTTLATVVAKLDGDGDARRAALQVISTKIDGLSDCLDDVPGRVVDEIHKRRGGR